MNENKFWLCIWSLVAAVIIAFIVACTISSIHSARLLAASPNPMELACAWDGQGYSLKQNCVVLMSRKAQP